VRASGTNELPQSREQLAARLFEAFNRRDIEAALELVHPDVVFEPVSAVAIRDGAPYVGHDGMRAYLDDVERYFDELVVNPTQIRAAGDAVVALGEVSGRAAGGPFDGVATTWMLKFRDDRVIRAQVFADQRNVMDILGASRAPA
jgi:ketosteroid isomerase-like protein